MGCSQTLLSDAFQDSKDKAEVAGGHFGGSLWSRAGGRDVVRSSSHLRLSQQGSLQPAPLPSNLRPCSSLDVPNPSRKTWL